eukprot:jgi/Pico_ML_1/53328/g3896.t1
MPRYETEESDAFTWRFEPGRPNPNDLVLLDDNFTRAVRELETMMDEQSKGSGNAKDIAIAGLVFGLVGFMIGAFLIFTTQCSRGSKSIASF